MAELIASGNVWNLNSLGDYESRFAEGDRGRVDLQLHYAVPSQIVSGLDSALRAAGVKLTQRVEQTHSTPTIRIHFQKANPALVIIAIAAAASIVLIAAVFAWQLTKVPAPLAAIGGGITIIIIIAIVGVLALSYFSGKSPVSLIGGK